MWREVAASRTYRSRASSHALTRRPPNLAAKLLIEPDRAGLLCAAGLVTISNAFLVKASRLVTPALFTLVARSGDLFDKRAGDLFAEGVGNPGEHPKRQLADGAGFNARERLRAHLQLLGQVFSSESLAL